MEGCDSGFLSGEIELANQSVHHLFLIHAQLFRTWFATGLRGEQRGCLLGKPEPCEQTVHHGATDLQFLCGFVNLFFRAALGFG
jgi:hypothetical protein